MGRMLRACTFIQTLPRMVTLHSGFQVVTRVALCNLDGWIPCQYCVISCSLMMYGELFVASELLQAHGEMATMGR